MHDLRLQIKNVELNIYMNKQSKNLVDVEYKCLPNFFYN